MAHIAENTHYYRRDGTPAYEVPNKSKPGETRAVTLADARKDNLLPGTTGILKCQDRPGLTSWLIEQHILATMTLPRGLDESDKDFIRRVKLDAQEHGKSAAEKGTEIHAAVQGYFEGVSPTEEYLPYVQGAIVELETACGVRDWKCETAFAHHAGYGGKVDLACIDWVVDIKGKDFGPDDKVVTYLEHWQQLAAYQRGIGMYQSFAGILFVSRNNPGLARFVQVSGEQLGIGLATFDALLAYWKAKNKYDPSFNREAA